MATQPTAPRSSHRQGGIPDGLLVAVLVLLLCVTVLMWAATGLAALFGHGHWPRGLHFTRTPQAMRALLVHPADVTAAWPQVPAADLPRPGLLWGVFLSEALVLLVLAGFAIGALARFRAARTVRRQAAALPPARTAPAAPHPYPVTPSTDPQLHPAGHLQERPQEVPAPQPLPMRRSIPPETFPVEQAEPVMPSGPPDQPQPAAAGRPTAQPLLRDAIPLTATHVLFAGARSGKAEHVIAPAVLDAAGAAIVTCADDTIWQRTAGARAKLGPVHVFDPEHLVDAPERLRWAPHSGCQDPQTAASRARALLAPLRTHDVTANDAAATLLRCWLHAAAVADLPFRQLHRWATGNGQGAGEALRILRTSRDAASGWSGELEATLYAHPERRVTAQTLIQHALSGLNSVHLRDACNPGRNGSKAFDPESFLRDGGTLYAVGEPREDPRTRPGAMPLLTALVSSVVEHGRRMAARSSSGRLDPPLTCVFDDVAALAPLPELPGLMADGPAAGITVLSVLRSEEQARHRWPPREAAQIWQAAASRHEGTP